MRRQGVPMALVLCVILAGCGQAAGDDELVAAREVQTMQRQLATELGLAERAAGDPDAIDVLCGRRRPGVFRCSAYQPLGARRPALAARAVYLVAADATGAWRARRQRASSAALPAEVAGRAPSTDEVPDVVRTFRK